MAAPSISNTLVDGQMISAGPLNTNFSDLVSGLSAGTWDLTTLSITTTTLTPTTIAGAANFTGTPTFAVKATFSGSNIAKTSAPVADTVYPNNICKAWAVLTAGAAGAVTVTEGFNVNTATYSGNIFTINFHTNLASANYAVSVAAEAVDAVGNLFTGGYVLTGGKAVGSVQIVATKRDGNVVAIGSGDVLHVMIFGTQ